MATVWVVSLLLAFLASNFAAEDGGKAKARLETCGGWRLNRLPQVKQFINEDSGKYPDLEVKYIGGIDPVMVLLKEGGEEEIERVPVAEKTRDEINELLASHGLTQKVESDEEEESDEEQEKQETEEEQPAEEKVEETGEEQPAEEKVEETGEEQPREEKQEETGEENKHDGGEL